MFYRQPYMAYPIMMVLKCIVVLALVIVIDCYASTEIERGDYDTFENPTCFSETGGCNCNGLNAHCFDQLCEKCKCSGDYKTFLPVGKHGSCVKDIYLLFFPSNTNSFLVQERIKWWICLSHYRPSDVPNTYFVIGTNCNSSDPTQHWIWTQYNQLLNLDTLKCLQRSTTWGRYAVWKTYYYHLILGNCVTMDIKQTWDCADSNYMYSFRLPLINSYKYMSYGIYGSYILAGRYYSSLDTTWQRRYQSGATLCSKAFGCNEFSNPSSAIFVTDINCAQCQGEKQINVPHNYSNCKIVWDQSKFLDYTRWEQLPFNETIFTITEYGQLQYLEWNFTNASYKWNGLIVKLQFSCTVWSGPGRQSTQLGKCILIKFKGKHTDPTVAPTTEPSTRVVSTKFSTTARTPTSGALLTTASTPDEIKPTPTLSPRPTSFPSPTNPTDEIKPTPTLSPRPTSFPSPTDRSSPLTSKMSNTTSVIRERQKSEPLNVVSIVVPLVVIILVLCGVLGLIFYKRRRSHAKESPPAKDQDANDKGGSSVKQTSAVTLNPIYSPADNSFAPHYSDDGGVYQEPTSGASQVCDLYESGGDHDYDYAKVDQNNHRTPLPEETYDYANSNDIRPVAQPNSINKKTPKHACESKVEGEENTCPLYQTLDDSSANGLEMSPITNNNKKDPNESNVEGGENISPVYQTLDDPYENE